MRSEETNHGYPCSLHRFCDCNDKGDAIEFENWKEYKQEVLESPHKFDINLNLCFRFDLEKKLDENEEETDEYELYLFFMKQRLGLYTPIIINYVTEEDIPEIEGFLKQHWEYLKGLWKEFS